MAMERFCTPADTGKGAEGDRSRSRSRRRAGPELLHAEPAPISLNVGGSIFVTSLATLRSPCAANTWFGAQLSDNFRDAVEGEIFIDRSPNHFPQVLNFLRDGFCVLPDDLCDLRELYREADYYSMTTLKEMIEKTSAMQKFCGTVDRGSCAQPYNWRRPLYHKANWECVFDTASPLERATAQAQCDQ